MPISESMVQDIVSEVMAKMQIAENPSGKHGIFKDMNEAIEAAKKAQNIQQHTTICIPARKVPHFKPSESFLVLRKEDNRK